VVYCLAAGLDREKIEVTSLPGIVCGDVKSGNLLREPVCYDMMITMTRQFTYESLGEG
jgi:hypothetical protein